MGERHILATSGGMLSERNGPLRWRFGPLLRYALELSGASRPQLCFVDTATGDASANLLACYGASIGEDVVASHVALFPRPNVESVRDHLLSQDVVWVGGGSVANLLAIWRTHGLDEVFKEAWESGVVLAGVSAGSICWHVGGTTDSLGPRLELVDNGLGFLPYGNGVHYDSEPRRRPLIHELVGKGALPLTYATEDGTGLHYLVTELVEAVSDQQGKSAYVIIRDAEGFVKEEALSTRLLPERS